MGSDANNLEGKKCVKCPNDAKYTGIDPKKAWYCKECFIQMVKNKFRTALSKRKIYKDSESRDTLVVYDGTPSSSFLLHQIDDALRQVNFKRLMIQPTMLILVSVTTPEEISQVTNRLNSLKAILPDKIRWIIAHVACCLLPNISLSVDPSDSDCYGAEKIGEYLEILNSCKIPTYRQELERILKEKCLKNICNSMKIYKVMIPDDSDILARHAIGQLCLGRGGSSSTLTSILDKRDNIIFIRPLKDICKKEIGIVNNLSGFDKDCIQLKDEIAPQKSIQFLTSNFIQTLENENYLSTVNTVLSTASKIHGIDETKQSIRCRLCEIENELENGLCDTCMAIKNQCLDDNLSIFL